MKTPIRFFFLFLLSGISFVNAQVKIGENPQNIDLFSILELEDNSRALVITRLTTPQMNGMTPLRGALVYNTDASCVFYYDGANWVNLCEDESSVNVSLEVIDDELVLTDSSDNRVSIALEEINAITFSTDAIVNPTEPIARDSTIVITQNGTNYNFEVGEITGENIVDSTINGFLDIQDGTITGSKLSETVAGDGLSQAVDGSLNVDLAQVMGTGQLSTNGTIEINGQPVNALFNDVILDVADNAITNLKLADNAVNSDNIIDGQVQTVDIVNDGVTLEKIGTTGLADANRILGTDAAGDPQWQDAALLANNLGENVTSTDGSISGTANDAALVPMDLQVNVDNSTIEVDATNGLQIPENGITIDEIREGLDGQVLVTNGTDVEWNNLTDNSVTGSVLFSDGAGGITENNAQLFWDGDMMAIGAAARPLINKLTIDGSTRTSGLLNSAGSAGVPSYRFSDDGDTGMFLVDASGILGFSANNAEAMRIDASQNVGIGPAFSGGATIGAKLHVDGNIWADGEFRASGVLIDNDAGPIVPDYVFQNYFDGYSNLKEDYLFKSLAEIEAFVKKNKHLPGITSAAQAQRDGHWNLSRSNLQNLEKIEELFLHTIEQEKKINTLQQENDNLMQEVACLKRDMEAIKALILQKEEDKDE